jgi:hypothetical protein
MSYEVSALAALYWYYFNRQPSHATTVLIPLSYQGGMIGEAVVLDSETALRSQGESTK